MTSRLPRYEAKCVQCRCFQCGSVPLHLDIKETELPPANILILLERQLIALQLCHWQFLYNETLQQTVRPLLSKLSKRWQIQVLYPHFEEVKGGVELWLMARWKARVEFLLSVIELLFLSLAVEALQGKMCENSLPSWGGRSLGAKISLGRGHPPGNILIPLETQLITPLWGIYSTFWSNLSKHFSFGGAIPLPLHRWGWNLAQRRDFTPIGATCHPCRAKNLKIGLLLT